MGLFDLASPLLVKALNQPATTNPIKTTELASPTVASPIRTITSGTTQSAPDMRVRLRAMDGHAYEVYGPNEEANLLKIFHETNGLLFPYTPTIGYSQDVEYSSISTVHTNQDFLAYTRTASVPLSVTGKFSVQNNREGRYMLAVLHFLRTVSKMHFGNDPLAGLPPPPLVFDAYGNFAFNKLPVVLKNHSYSFDDNVDMVTVPFNGTYTRVPSLLSITLSLQVQRTPAILRTFNLDKFRTGELMTGTNKGWI